MSRRDDEWLTREAFAICDRLAALDAEERATELARLAVDAPPLHLRVLRLLEAEQGAEASGFLDAGAEQLLGRDAAIGGEPGLAAGTRLGAYRLERLLGAGGMGEVWLGSRIDGLYEGQVAIKTLHPHLVRRGLRERFAREGRLLARLEHPNIARLLDAGVDESGELFLVLEYVDGQPIDRWCDERRLGLEARVRLLLEVCDAVAAAHAQHIVHRDLKPSNILVTAEGRPKLLDFGIARLVESDAADAAELTRLGGRALTPEYAAPEQVLGLPASAATDGHALGLLLYESLTGLRPWELVAATPAQVERAVVEQEPLLPSQAARREEAGLLSAATRAAARNLKPAQLAGALRGALDTILLHALKKAPGERYRNAAELAEDLRRHLADQPIRARPDSFARRSGRFVRRYRTMVAAAGLVLAALLAGLAAALWQAGLARAEARKAEAARDFLVEVFASDEAGRRGGARLRAATAEQLLARGAQRLRSSSDTPPELRADLLGAIGRLYRDLLLLPPALDLLREQVAVRRATAQDRAGRHALARALLDHGAALTAAADYDASEKEIAEALSLLDAPDDQRSAERVDALATQAENAYWRLPALDDSAGRLFAQALALVESDHPQHPQRIAILLGLARSADQAGDEAGNERRLREALVLAGAPDAPWPLYELATAHRLLGELLRSRQQYAEADTELRRALAMFEDAEGSDSAWTAMTRRELATLLAEIGERGEALQLLETASAALDRRADAESAGLAAHLALAHGWLLYQRGLASAAAARLAPAVAASTAEPSELHASLTRLARARLAEGDSAEAQRLLDRALPVLRADRGEHSLAYANWLTIAAERLLDDGDPQAALARIDEAAAAWDSGDPQHLHIEDLREAWDRARAQLALGHAADAERAMRTLLSRLGAQPQAAQRPDEEAWTRTWLGRALLAQGEAAAALPELARALQLREKLDDPAGLWLAEARLDQAQALAALGRKLEAQHQQQLARQALTALPKIPSHLRRLAIAS